MIEIFNKIPPISVGVLKPNNWLYVQEGFKANIKTVEDYYKNNIKPVKSNHLLVRLLQSITIPKKLPLQRYYDHVDSIAMDLSMVFKFTSSIYKGSVFRGTFYGGSNPEFILAIEQNFDIGYVDSNWKNICAIKPILHPKSDLNYCIANGIQYSDEVGPTVFTINIPMLAIQYRAFCIDEYIRNKDNPRGTTYFIGAYVLPNMIKAHTELALFNRIYNYVNEIESNDIVNRKHPFPLINNKPFINHAIEIVDMCLDRSSKSYRTVFSTLPSIYDKNLYETLLVPNVLLTRQVDWLVVLSRLKMMDFLITVADKEILSKNQLQLNQVLKTFRVNDVYKVFKELLPLDVFYTIDGYVDRILEVTNKNTF